MQKMSKFLKLWKIFTNEIPLAVWNQEQKAAATEKNENNFEIGVAVEIHVILETFVGGMQARTAYTQGGKESDLMWKSKRKRERLFIHFNTFESVVKSTYFKHLPPQIFAHTVVLLS